MAELSSAIAAPVRRPWLRPGLAVAVPSLPKAGIVALATLAFFSFFIYTQALSFLPDYPAVLAAFLVWMVAPGWLLQRTLMGSRRSGVLEQLAFAFLCSMALSAVPGLLSLQLHERLRTFAIGYAVAAAIANGLVVLWHRRESVVYGEAAEEQGSSAGSAPLAVILGVTIAVILLSPIWAGGRVSRDYDSYIYVSYVNHYDSTGSLSASGPYFSQSAGAFGRMGVNVWLASQALLADNAGVEPYDLLMTYLPPLMTVLAVSAMFTLALGLFRSRVIALSTGIFALLYATLDLSSYESFGRNLFLRIAQDKLTASFVLLPLGLLFASSFLVRRSARNYAAFVLSVVALFAVHPMGVEFLLIAVALLVASRALVERSLAPARDGGLLLIPWGIVGVLALVGSQLAGSNLYSGGAGLRLPGYITLVDLGHGLIMGNFHLLLHPLLIAGVLLAPLVWLASRRAIGGQVILAITFGALLLLFVPVFATPLSDVVSEQGVWRLPWMIPIPMTLAYATSLAVDKLVGGRSSATRHRPAWQALAPAAGILLVVSGAFVVQEQYARLDNGSYFIRTSPHSLLPWTGGSIERGGVSYAFSAGSRPSRGTLSLMRYLRTNAPEGSTVLMPQNVEGYVAVLLHNVQFARENTPAVAAFYGGNLHGEELRQALSSDGIDFVVASRSTISEDAIRVFAEYDAAGDAAALQATEGAGVAVRRAGGLSLPAWSFGPNTPERLSDGRFTVPLDANPLDLRVDFVLAAAPSAPVVGDGAVQFELSAVRVDSPGGPGSRPISAVLDVHFADGTAAGTPISANRVLGGGFVPGATYAFTLSRLAEAPGDTYPSDLWLIWLKVRYWPERLTRVPGSGYLVYDLGR